MAPPTGGTVRAELLDLSVVQQLEVLRVPCDFPHVLTAVAGQLPRLRSLDLWCCTAGAAPEGLLGQLTLAAATALTQLRLHMSLATADIVQRLQMPPRLQVLSAEHLAKWI